MHQALVESGVCVCVCVRERELSTHTHTHFNIYELYQHIIMAVKIHLYTLKNLLVV